MKIISPAEGAAAPFWVFLVYSSLIPTHLHFHIPEGSLVLALLVNVNTCEFWGQLACMEIQPATGLKLSLPNFLPCPVKLNKILSQKASMLSDWQGCSCFSAFYFFRKITDSAPPDHISLAPQKCNSVWAQVRAPFWRWCPTREQLSADPSWSFSPYSPQNNTKSEPQCKLDSGWLCAAIGLLTLESRSCGWGALMEVGSEVHGQVIQEKCLYFPLRFAINLKLSFSKKSICFIKKQFIYSLTKWMKPTAQLSGERVPGQKEKDWKTDPTKREPWRSFTLPPHHLWPLERPYIMAEPCGEKTLPVRKLREPD